MDRAALRRIETLEAVRCLMVAAREVLENYGHEHNDTWAEPAEGLLTCGIVTLYDAQRRLGATDQVRNEATVIVEWERP